MTAFAHVGPYALDGLLFQDERRVLPWMAERIEGMAGQGFGCAGLPATGIGVLSRPGDGPARLVGGVAYSFWFDHPEGGECQISMVMEPGARVTRTMWRRLYGHAFATMNCRRMSCQTLKRNRAARDHLVRAGFTYEGCRPEAHGRQDVVMYGLLRRHMRNGLPPIRLKKEGAHHG